MLTKRWHVKMLSYMLSRKKNLAFRVSFTAWIFLSPFCPYPASSISALKYAGVHCVRNTQTWPTSKVIAKTMFNQTPSNAGGFREARCYCGGKYRRTQPAKCTKVAVNAATYFNTIAAVNASDIMLLRTCFLAIFTEFYLHLPIITQFQLSCQKSAKKANLAILW